MSAFPTVVDDAAFCGPAGEFVLAREPHSEIAALRSARASAPAQLPTRQRASHASLRVRLRAALDEGQRQREEIARLRGAGACAWSRAGAGARRSRPPHVSASAPSSALAPQGQSVLEAVLERITYANEDTGYTIARVATERTGPDLLTVVGPLLGAQVGESLRLTGRWSSHPKYGKQFQVDSFTTVLPATIQGIRRYLGSGLIKGIGPMMAERMVAHFGTDILTIIEEQPGRLIEVHGLGPKRTQRIADAWEEQKAIKEVMVFLSGIGVSTSLAVRIYKATPRTRSRWSAASPTGWPQRCGGSASRPPTRSPRRSGSRTTAPSGSKPGCSTPSRKPPITGTATSPSLT